MGDSSLFLFGSRFFKTKEHQHYFNCPYQLGTNGDKEFLKYELTVKEGDRIVMGSDGLFDNLNIVEHGNAINHEHDWQAD